MLIDDIERFIGETPGLTATQLASALVGLDGYNHRVSGVCQALARFGRVAWRGHGGPGDPLQGAVRDSPPSAAPLGSGFDPLPPLTPERNTNYVPYSFRDRGEKIMVRAVAEEALALASITLFLGMVAVWAQVLGVL